MAKIKVQVQNEREVLVKLSEIKNETKNKVKSQIKLTSKAIESMAKSEVPVDLGRLRDSIKTDISPGGMSASIFSDVEHSKYIEFGTSPHFPPPDALRGWARRHGMAGLEFVIARKIARRGTPAQPFLTPAFEQNNKRFIAAVTAILRGID